MQPRRPHSTQPARAASRTSPHPAASRSGRLPLLFLALSLACSCLRNDVQTVRIHVPGMSDNAAAAIVRNALENELERSDSAASVQMDDHLVTLTRSAMDLPAAKGLDNKKKHLSRQIVEGLHEVGFSATVRRLDHLPWCPFCGQNSPLGGPQSGYFVCSNQRPNPACPRHLPVADVAASSEPWANRYTVSAEVPAMQSTRDANVAVAAVWHALRGINDPAVAVDLASQTATVQYNSVTLARKNLEHAVANAGLQANEVPANLAAANGLVHGW